MPRFPDEYTEKLNPIANDKLLLADTESSNAIKSVSSTSLGKMSKWIEGKAIKDGEVTPEIIMAGTGSSWDWQSWTPAFTGLTVGNGTSYAKYKQVGKTVFFRYRLVFGTTTSISGDVSMTLPVNCASEYAGNNTEPIGVVNLSDTGSQIYDAQVSIKDVNEIIIRAKGAGGAYVTAASVLSSTVPFTWTTNDRIELSGAYEAA